MAVDNDLMIVCRSPACAAAFFQKGAGGRLTTTYDMNDANARPAKPHQITRRLLAYPYTSVSTSPNTYEIGKKSTPAPNVNAPTIGRASWAIFAGRFLGPFRATVPLVAGMSELEFWPFQIANAASAVIWAYALLAFPALATHYLTT